MKNCLLCGVGGQGTVLASRIIAAAAIEKGYFARTAETIGMAQRGGSVVSHVRFGEAVPSPLIPQGKADLILGFEPGEVVRNLSYLKKGCTVILCNGAVQPVTAALAETDYRGEEMVEFIRCHVDHCFVLDTEQIIKEGGSPKIVNVALLGAMAKTGVLGITAEEIKEALKKKVKAQFIAMNEKALDLGAAYIEEKKS